MDRTDPIVNMVTPQMDEPVRLQVPAIWTCRQATETTIFGSDIGGKGVSFTTAGENGVSLKPQPNQGEAGLFAVPRSGSV